MLNVFKLDNAKGSTARIKFVVMDSETAVLSDVPVFKDIWISNFFVDLIDKNGDSDTVRDLICDTLESKDFTIATRALKLMCKDEPVDIIIPDVVPEFYLNAWISKLESFGLEVMLHDS
jgi:hypothetical protein